MNSLSFRTNHPFLLTVIIIFVSGSFFALWASAHADGELTIPGPGLITEKKTVKVSDPNKTGRVFAHANFKSVAEPAGIVTITNPTADDGNFGITPLKSGKATLTIEYTDGDTKLKGILELTVPYKKLQVEGLGEPPLRLIARETKQFNIFGVDVAGGNPQITEADTSSSAPNVVKATFANQKLQLEAQSPGTANVVIKVFGISSEPIAVAVEGVTRIEVNNRGAVGSGEVQISIPESETRQLKVKIVGSNGTEFRRSDVALETTVSAGNTCGAPIEATYDDKDDSLLNVTTPALVGGCNTTDRTVTLRIPPGKFAQAPGVTTIIKIAITQKIGFIRLTATSPVLTQNGRINVNAEVFDRNNTLVSPTPNVSFELRNGNKDAVWVSLVKEGNKATLVSRNPSQKEVRDANDNELVRRPSDVVIIAKTRPQPGSPEVESQIIIPLAEVVGFDLLKVKLNIMDDRTAADLYGKVTSDEYYVLTLRLFNNLRDERTGEFSGNSILAYSSSIEVAVQLEKRFDRGGSKSYFPNVVSKSELQTLTNNEGRLAAIKQSQTDLNTAMNAQYASRQAAIKKVNDMVVKRTRAEKLTIIAKGMIDPDERTEAFDAANVAITEYNQAWVGAHTALEQAAAAEDEVMKLRAQLARDAATRAADSDAYVADPDTAIDDGKWHPMSSADLLRLGPSPAPPPLERPIEGPLPLLTNADFRAKTRRASSSGASEEKPPPSEEDPPCRGVITYRPFTFEMMVNTVDRRDNRSVRSRVFKVLDFIGTGTSFVTAVAVPGPSSDLPLGLEKFSNLLLPGLDKLFPNYKEQQRQNIVSQAMKEIEEIPFASDITRVIFIPKRNIHGLVRGHDVRISEICPFFFRIQVAIVSKNATVEQGVIR